MALNSKIRNCNDYHVAWICPLADVELMPSRLMLDEELEAPPYNTYYDENQYKFGTINGHAVVLATCPQGETGNVNAGRLTGSMFKTFPNVRMAVLVGIGGGIPRSQVSPDPLENIRLGDVVVGWPGDGKPACVYHDRGRSKVGGEFELVGTLQNPEWRLTQALSNLASDHEMELTTFADQIKRLGKYKKFKYPGLENDKLYKATSHHHGKATSDCAECDHDGIVQRPPRDLYQRSKFVYHQGRIATGNSVIRDGKLRDDISARCDGAICVEMEAAGVDTNRRCLVIRGISDYADSHKNDTWKNYAAGNAAAFTRELLCRIQPELVKELKRIPEACWLVPLKRTPLFTGRETQLEKAQEHVLLGQSKRLAIHGLGGCGKTALALELAYRTKEQQPERAIFWVPAISQESFEQAYRDIGILLRIPGIQDEEADVKQLVQAILSEEDFGPWLMIVDNADDVTVLLNPLENGESGSWIDFLPHSSNGSFVFTTRSLKSALKLAGNNIVGLTELNEFEARSMLEKGLGDKELLRDERVVHQFLDMLTFLPIAIVQAVAFINANSITLSKYKALYDRSQENAIGLLGEDFDDEGRYTDSARVTNPVATTWFISFDALEKQDKLAASLLSFMSFMASNAIPISLLVLGEPGIDAVKAIGTLKAYAFITERHKKGDQDDQNSDVDAFDVHPLVHLATRNWLERLGRWKSGLEQAVTQLSTVFTCAELIGGNISSNCIPHAKHVLSLTKDQDEQHRIPLLNAIAYCERAVGNVELSERAFREAYQHKKKTNGDSDVLTLLSENVLAWALTDQKKHAEAEDLTRQTIRKIEEVRGKEDYLTLTCKATLAKALSGLGKHQEAVKLFEELATTKERLYGKENADTLVNTTFLAQALHFQGNNRQAEKIHRETLALRQKVLGKERPDTARSMNHLAVVLCRLGKYAEAESMHREASRLMANVLGIGDIDTLESRRGLSIALARQGKSLEAEQIHHELLEQSKKALGERHPKTLGHMHSLAMLLHFHHKRGEAITLMAQCYELQEEIHGPHHPETKATWKELKEMRDYWKTKVLRFGSQLLLWMVVGHSLSQYSIDIVTGSEATLSFRRPRLWHWLFQIVFLLLLVEGEECWLRIKRYRHGRMGNASTQVQAY